jgi:hypothetical protein
MMTCLEGSKHPPAVTVFYGARKIEILHICLFTVVIKVKE